MRLVKVLVFVCLLIHLVSCATDRSIKSPSGRDERLQAEVSEEQITWRMCSKFILNHASQGSDVTGMLTFEHAGNQELLISVRGYLSDAITVSPGSQQGEILVVAEKAMLTRSFEIETGYEIYALDGATLLYRLALSILDRIYPEGPTDVNERRQVDFTELSETIYVSTTSAFINFYTPWSVKGYVEKKNKGKIAYDIIFNWTTPDKHGSENIQFFGEWIRTNETLTLPDDLKLDDWRIYRLGLVEKQIGARRIYDIGATLSATRYTTLGELRSAIAEEKNDTP
jgi:hypothetical protein